MYIRGATDPASRGRSQVDGRQLWQMYLALGLRLDTADNAVEKGVASQVDALKSTVEPAAEVALLSDELQGWLRLLVCSTD